MRQAKEGDSVSLHYKGSFEDGTVFDSSETHGALKFTVGRGTVIPGFEEAVVGMKLGEAKTVTIPPEKGYGPRNEELLMKIDKKELPPDLDQKVCQKLLKNSMVEIFISSPGHEKKMRVAGVEEFLDYSGLKARLMEERPFFGRTSKAPGTRPWRYSGYTTGSPRFWTVEFNLGEEKAPRASF